MKTIKNIYCKYPIIGSLILVFVIMEILHYLRHALPFNALNNYLISEILVAIVILTIIAWITGINEIKFSTVGFGYTFKLTWFLLLFGILLTVLGFALRISKGDQVRDPFIVIIECIIFALFVGLFEEGLYRGIFLSALLSRLGGTRKGLIWSLILSTLLFGFIHVYTDFFGFFTDPSTFSMGALGQVIGKIISAGIYGFVLAVAYIRTHNLWGVAIAHAINDLGGFLMDYLYDSNTQIGNYVNTGVPGGFSALSYLVEAIIMLPLIIYCFKQIKYVKLPQWGMFKEKWHPIPVEKTN